ncbi:hypothetical protein GALL_504620 [mine drainage metagenome]|uniref:Uncharacterized protein n=1 Tax=mine drainage metagenome TaxID=410659 RepID=A0A1J5P9S3_9ZZZZ
MIYLLNSPILTAYGRWSFNGPLSQEEANRRLTDVPATSAIGHAGSAEFLPKVLGRPAEAQRLAVKMQPDDEALVFHLLDRLPEGVVLTEDQLSTVDYELAWLRLDGTD